MAAWVFLYRDAAYLLVDYMNLSILGEKRFDPPCSLTWISDENPRPRTIIELGSGIGYVGLGLIDVLCRLGRSDNIILTDLPDVCPLLEEKLHTAIQSNGEFPKTVRWAVEPLPWGDEGYVRRLANILGVVSATGLETCKTQTLTDSPPLTHIVCSDLVNQNPSFSAVVCAD